MSAVNAAALLAAAGGDYQISRSVRLRSSASAYFNRTPASAGNRRLWTMSFWHKKTQNGVSSGADIFNCYVGASSNTELRFNSSDQLQSYYGNVGIALVSNQVFRDPSAWYHFVVVWDSNNATASLRHRIYVNGAEITSWATDNRASIGSLDSGWNSTNAHYLMTGNSAYVDGYLTEVNFIDGQALTPASFGETDSLTGVWKPKKYAGTYGTNGFYLNFSDNSAATAAAIGKDSSGNGNNWTPNNISVTAGVTYDSMLDVPTMWVDGGNGRGNYAVINPLAAGSDATVANANLSVSYGTGATIGTTLGTMGMTSGQWYWENTITASSLTACTAYVGMVNQPNPTGAGAYPGATSRGWGYYGNLGNIYNNGSAIQTGLSTFGATNDVVGIAFDADAGTLKFYKNNTQIGTTITGIAADTYFPAWSDGSQGNTFTIAVNFGQRPFAYTPPTGFKALNTQNLPDATIKKGNQYFDVSKWTGNGSTQSITGLAFQPDLVWSKDRSAANFHALYDSVRGATKAIQSNTTTAEQTFATGLTSFNADGFTTGSNSDTNANGDSYVAWQWKESASAGFDIVTYTGNGALRTIAHSLGVAPRMVIVKSRSAGSTNWCVQHASIGATHVGYMNLTNAFTTNASMWNNTAPTSSVFTVNTNTDVNGSGASLVAYLFAEVAGFSKFGSYTGNGSADGPFVYLGFRPKYIMTKRIDSTSDWAIWDTSRAPSNLTSRALFAHLANAEDGTDFGDFLSNGVKLRQTIYNVNGGTYIYAAFAEHPFKNSLAR